MSLLNEMLKDLNKKPSHTPSISPIPEVKKNWFKLSINLLGGLTIIAMLSFLIVIAVPWFKHTAPLVSTIASAPSFLVETAKNNVSQIEAQITLNNHYEEQLNHALKAIQDGEDSRAIDLLTQLLKAFPTLAEASENLAALYLAYSEFEKATDVLDKALTHDSHHLRLTMMKSRLLVEKESYQEALVLLEKFNPDMAKSPDYYALLAAIFNTLGRTTEAGSLYQSLIKLDPTNGQYCLGLGIALEQKNSIQQAIAAYKQASQSEYVQPAVRAYAESRLKILQG
ncbi:MAG: tetratricopeptide repeat protein [Legionella sp.]|nr:tetratricopeptide repeat protein [Legionella sp.]